MRNSLIQLVPVMTHTVISLNTRVKWNEKCSCSVNSNVKCQVQWSHICLAFYCFFTSSPIQSLRKRLKNGPKMAETVKFFWRPICTQHTRYAGPFGQVCTYWSRPICPANALLCPAYALLPLAIPLLLAWKTVKNGQKWPKMAKKQRFSRVFDRFWWFSRRNC